MKIEENKTIISLLLKIVSWRVEVENKNLLIVEAKKPKLYTRFYSNVVSRMECIIEIIIKVCLENLKLMERNEI